MGCVLAPRVSFAAGKGRDMADNETEAVEALKAEYEAKLSAKNVLINELFAQIQAAQIAEKAWSQRYTTADAAIDVQRRRIAGLMEEKARQVEATHDAMNYARAAWSLVDRLMAFGGGELPDTDRERWREEMNRLGDVIAGKALLSAVYAAAATNTEIAKIISDVESSYMVSEDGVAVPKDHSDPAL